MRAWGSRVGVDARRRRERAKRKASLHVVQTTDADDFAASVERDLANLPTTEDEYRRTSGSADDDALNMRVFGRIGPMFSMFFASW